MKRGLGKGLLDLLEEKEGELFYVDVSQIKPNPFQTRRDFTGIDELAESIKQSGVLQPILLRKNEDGTFTLIAGERRWRAALKAGLKRIPAIIKDIDERESAVITLVENVMRDDLSPLELAEDLEKLRTEFSLTHEELAGITGMDRSSITNLLRLLKLPEKIKEALHRGEINAGQARALLSIKDPKRMMDVFEKIKRRNLSVREVEETVKKIKGEKPSEQKVVEEALARFLGTKVVLGKKYLKIYFKDKDELERIIQRLRGGEE